MQDPDPLVRGTNHRIWIRTKEMSRISRHWYTVNKKKNTFVFGPMPDQDPDWHQNDDDPMRILTQVLHMLENKGNNSF